MGQWVVSVRRHEPPSQSGIHPGRFPWRSYRAVHDRYIISPRQVHDRPHEIQPLRGDTGNPCGMTLPLMQRPTRAQCRSPRRHASSPPGGGRGALGHHLRGSLDEMARADPAARPGRTHEQDQPAAQRKQDGEEPADRNAQLCTSQTSGPDARTTGQNGHGSAKRAVIRTAPSARTLYTICTQPLLCIDPQ
jgi:hypothetical protein